MLPHCRTDWSACTLQAAKVLSPDTSEDRDTVSPRLTAVTAPLHQSVCDTQRSLPAPTLAIRITPQPACNNACDSVAAINHSQWSVVKNQQTDVIARLPCSAALDIRKWQ